MSDKKLFDREIVTTASGSKMIAIGDAISLAQNMTLDSLKALIGSKTSQLIVPIGAWNMNASSMSPQIGLAFPPIPPFLPLPTPLAISRIRGVKVLILTDAGTNASDFLSVQNGTDLTVPQIQIGELFMSTVVTLMRRAGSFYATSTDYNDGVVNRGWVIVDYI